MMCWDVATLAYKQAFFGGREREIREEKRGEREVLNTSILSLSLHVTLEEWEKHPQSNHYTFQFDLISLPTIPAPGPSPPTLFSFLSGLEYGLNAQLS